MNPFKVHLIDRDEHIPPFPTSPIITAVGNTSKGQAQLSAANGNPSRLSYRLSEEELLQHLKSLPTTSMASTDSDLSELMAAVTEEGIPVAIPSPAFNPPQQQHQSEYPPRQAEEEQDSVVQSYRLEVPKQRTKKSPQLPTESTDMLSLTATEEDQDQAEATKTISPTASVHQNENPLNYVAALRLRQEQGRRSSRDLFEEPN